MNNMLQVQIMNNLKMDVPKKNNLIMETRTVKLKKSVNMWPKKPKRIYNQID